MSQENTPVCRFYVEKGLCRHNNECRFAHIDGICKSFFSKSVCEDKMCEFSHLYSTNNRNNRGDRRNRERKNNKDEYTTENIKDIKDIKDIKRRTSRKNTECFTPSFEPSDMTVKFATGSSAVYPHSYQPRDVVVVTELFSDMENVYEKLLEEIKQTGKEEKIWKLWHGDTHYIADDKLNYKQKCPTFTAVIERLTSYFNIDPKATRLNWFSDKNEWKPYHFDAAAVDPEKAKVQNFTVGVSFGDTREASFQHAKTKTTVNFPLENGSVYCFGSQVNMEWRHGIPPITEDKFGKGRISVIVWGWVDMQ
jgi:hypothetical protein